MEIFAVPAPLNFMHLTLIEKVAEWLSLTSLIGYH